MIGVEIGVVGVVGVEIGNPWFLDYGFGWRWRWRWLGLVGEGWVWSGWRSVVGVVVFVGKGWVFLGLVGVGGDRWSGWSFLLEKAGFFKVFLGLIRVEIDGRFCTV